MIRKIDIKKIRPNPFQVRNPKSQAMSKEALELLAEEIKDHGYWESPLRARQKGDIFEIAWGHRRLRALKKAGFTEVKLDVQDLTDRQMKVEMAVENFQRHDFTEGEKAKVIDILREELGDDRVAICRLLGIAERTYYCIRKLGQYIERDPEVRKAVNEGRTSSRQVSQADTLGGERMVRRAIKDNINSKDLEEISQKIKEVTTEDKSPRYREKLVEAAIKGRIQKGKDVAKEKNRIVIEEYEGRIKDQRKKTPPPDLVTVVEQWCEDLPEIIMKLKIVASKKDYAKYIMDCAPATGVLFKRLLKELVEASGQLESQIIPRIAKSP